ncbi:MULTISPECIES: sodium/glutamate symporter [Providencia]|uniref:Sodium/glutamate symporter n=14 Tax=Gammaproteobacteria TaxID=1236 RepID=A0AA42FS27_9GAMM|nr:MULTISPECIES: sodium/glutamate symporter [Providencia]MBC8654406.1 sodium:glutamate symporter [Providencia vermicola]HCI96105.1 sodium:glutamate symporter [Providencia sp.]APC10496.1 Sodium/glutamate symport carrier protein [Providencia rettgeri]AVL74114.1 sodium:glutamate symporter [Providencia rettgeri]EIU7558451.1 sodium:glutamate symporter [Providencia rettgeri]
MVTDEMLTIKLDMITFTALGALLLIASNVIIKKFPFFMKYSIPSPVIGGFIFSVIMWLAYQFNIVELSFDNTLYDLSMYVFFVTIGLMTGVKLLVSGGKILLLYMVICWGLAFAQNGVSLGLSYVLDIEPLIAMMAGQASMQGGHGMAASLAPLIESFGYDQALNVGLAASTFGLIAGSILGGPVGNWLIKRNNLKIETDHIDLDDLTEKESKEDKVTPQQCIVTGAVILSILAIGMPTAKWISEATGFTIPGHIFSLFVGVIFHSFNERKPIIKISRSTVVLISTISLEMFLVMAMMKLKLWELYELALPLTIILITQVIATVLVAIFIVYRALGRNYDAAVMSAGFIGHGLGATPNGLVVMDAICNKYGLFSRKAFIIIPIAGTVLTDIVGVPLFVFLANTFGS